MAPQSVRFFDGHKFMWDGAVYPSREAAEAREKEYGDNRFETRFVEEENAFLIYTRRVVTEVVVEGEAPPA
jgi:hypothetical protein